MLLFALCKGDTNDWVLEKACELAVRNVIIWQATHSVVKIKTEADAQKKLLRWSKICESAAKQSGNPHITKPHFTIGLEAAINSSKQIIKPQDLKICCSLSTDTVDLNTLNPSINDICLAIGPEGDFSPEEMNLLKNEQFKFATLGPYTLRSETAAIAAISSLNALFAYKY